VSKLAAGKIIDAHAHIFPDKIAEKAVESIGGYYGIAMSGTGTVAGLLESGSRAGIYKYIVHSTATKMDQVKPINDFIAQVKEENKSFIGLGTIHPDFSDIDSEVDRIAALGLEGIKLHPDFQEFNIDDESMMPIYRAAEGRLPILMHMGDKVKTSSRPERLAKVLDLFPGLTVIAAHLGGYCMWDEAIECLAGRNLYFDTSSSLFALEPERAAEIIRNFGVEKVLFGTDYPMWTYEDELLRFDRLGMTEKERRLILYENACRLFNL
jgi:predicted TIM-barrel fold metal-dependent hydrolase